MHRWDVARPAEIDNLVLLTFEEAEVHEGEPDLEHVKQSRPAFVAFVEAKLDRVRREFMH